jgi:hypothetical protein
MKFVFFLLSAFLCFQAIATPIMDNNCAKALSVKTELDFELILGENSVALFDFLKTEEVAGLYRADALKKVDSTTSAFIAGLSNIFQHRKFIFLNLKRVRPDHSVLVHETVHMARTLMTIKYNPNVDLYKDPYIIIDDSNEEEFAETVEKVYQVVVSEFKKIEPQVCHSIQTL